MHEVVFQANGQVGEGVKHSTETVRDVLRKQLTISSASFHFGSLSLELIATLIELGVAFPSAHIDVTYSL